VPEYPEHLMDFLRKHESLLLTRAEEVRAA